MQPEDARKVVALVAGYWPGDFHDEETRAWTMELCGPKDILRQEAVGVLQDFARRGERFRPRVGQVVQLVLNARRRESTQYKALETPRSPRETAYYWLDKIRADNGLHTQLTAEDRVTIEDPTKYRRGS